ncbi:hypothetical protein C8R46DRAFT_1361177 [Mycena filopes]|nr:hypothetical protein C8R46DRAFT_1361177 [Mycena filopes]
MHPSLHVRNFSKLPISTRRIAIAATKGDSLDALDRISKLVVRTPSAIEFLPVCWVHLDEARLPSAGDLMAFVKDASRYMKPLLALEIVRTLECIEPRALADLWPRVWAWSNLFNAILGPAPGEDVAPSKILSSLFQFVDRIPVDLADTQPGLRRLVPEAWSGFLATGNPTTNGLAELWRFVDPGPSRISVAHLTHYMLGAGGELDPLIKIVHTQLSLGLRTQNVPCIRQGLKFMSDASLQLTRAEHSPAVREMNSMLPELICTLVRLNAEDDSVTDVLTQCVELMWTQLRGVSDFHLFARLVRKGLLRALVLLAPGDLAAAVRSWPMVYQLITDSLIQGSSCYSVLCQIVENLPEAEALIDEGSYWFAESPAFRQWERFVGMVRTRWTLAEEINSPDYISYRACDNLECGAIQQKQNLKACSLCRGSMYYCNDSCQRADWKSHRQICSNLKSLRFHSPYTPRDRSFLRALVHDTYYKNKLEIFHLLLANLRSKDAAEPDPCYIAIDYTVLPLEDLVAIKRLPFTASPSPQTDAEVEQAEWERRARVDRRIQLFSVVFPPQTPRILGMRFEDTRVQDELLRLARLEPITAADGGALDPCDAELRALARLDVRTAL